MYLYRGAAGRVLLVFNSIWKAIGAIFDGQNFEYLDKLTPFQMVCTPKISFGQHILMGVAHLLLMTITLHVTPT